MQPRRSRVSLDGIGTRCWKTGCRLPSDFRGGLHTFSSRSWWMDPWRRSASLSATLFLLRVQLLYTCFLASWFVVSFPSVIAGPIQHSNCCVLKKHNPSFTYAPPTKSTKINSFTVYPQILSTSVSYNRYVPKCLPGTPFSYNKSSLAHNYEHTKKARKKKNTHSSTVRPLVSGTKKYDQIAPANEIPPKIKPA